MNDEENRRRVTDNVEVMFTRLEAGIAGLAQALDLKLTNIDDRVKALQDSMQREIGRVRDEATRAHSRLDALEARIAANFRLALTSLILPIAVALVLALMVPR